MLDNQYDPTNSKKAPRKTISFSLWRALVILALFGVLIFAAVKGFAKNTPEMPKREAPAVTAPTPSPSAPAMEAAGDAGPAEAYPGPTDMPEATEIAMVATATQPAPVATEMPEPTATNVPPQPTATEVVEEPFDLPAVYSRELAKVLPETDTMKYNPKGADWVGGFLFTLEPGQYQVLFVAEGTISANGANYVVPGQGYRENAVVLLNKGTEAVEFKLTGFPPTGFGQWPYRLGTTPDVDEIIWANVGQGDYCGSGNNTGCHDAVQHDLVFDGSAFNAVTKTWDTPHKIVDNAKPVRTAAWDSVSMDAGWEVLTSNLSQPDAEFEVKSPDGVLYLGVTNGRDMVVWLPAGSTIIPPEGEPSAPLEKPSVVVLRNRIGDTVVYQITGVTSPVKFMEFRKDADPAAAGQFIVNYTVAQPAKAMFSAAAAPTDADSVGLVVLTNE